MTPQEELELLQITARARRRKRLRMERQEAFEESQPQDIGGGFGLDLFREGLQGLTFGLSDEAGAAAAAMAAKITQGVDFADAYRDILARIRTDQSQFREENPKTAIAANVVGGAGLGIPALAKKSGAAAAGAIAGFGFSEDEGAELAIDAGLGALLGLGGQVLFSSLGRAGQAAFRRLANRGVAVTDDAGRITEDAISALQDEFARKGISQDDAQAILKEFDDVLTPEQLARAKKFTDRGVTPLRANITQATDDFRGLQEASKASSELSDVVAQQNVQLADEVTRNIDRIRPAAQNVVETNANVFSVVDDVVTRADDAVSQAYAQARAAAPGERVVRYSNLTNKLKENLGKDRATGGVPSALRQDLRNKGVLTKGFDAKGRTTVETAEEVRQQLNALFDPSNPRGNVLVRELKDALDEDVAAAVGEDIFAGARQQKISLQRLIERGRRNKFDKSQRGFLEKVISNEIPEEQIVKKLLTGRDDDFVKFKTFLTRESGEQGQQAWQDIQAQVLREALDAATTTAGKAEGGVHVFNPNKFAQKFANLKRTGKYNELFEPDVRDMIDDVIEIGFLRTPQQLVQSGKGPSGFAIGEVKNEILRIVPMGDKVADLLERSAVRRTAQQQLNPTRGTERALRGARRPSSRTQDRQQTRTDPTL